MNRDTTKKYYVGSLPGDIQEQHIFSKFKKYGNITDLVLIKDKKTGKCAGFGFITFEAETKLDQEILGKIEKNKHFISGRELKVERHLSGESLQNHLESQHKKRLFIRNLPKKLSDQELGEFFSRFGEIESAYRVKIQSQNRLTNYGYVTFTEENPVDLVLGGKKKVKLEISGRRKIKVERFVKRGLNKISPDLGNGNGDLMKKRSKLDKKKCECVKKSSLAGNQQGEWRDRARLANQEKILIEMRLKPTCSFYHEIVETKRNCNEDNLRLNRTGGKMKRF